MGAGERDELPLPRRQLGRHHADGKPAEPGYERPGPHHRDGALDLGRGGERMQVSEVLQDGTAEKRKPPAG
jgi:hypothetical protein